MASSRLLFASSRHCARRVHYHYIATAHGVRCYFSRCPCRIARRQQTLRSAIAAMDKQRQELTSHHLHIVEPAPGAVADRDHERTFNLARASVTTSFHDERSVGTDVGPPDPGFQELAAMHLVRALCCFRLMKHQVLWPRTSMSGARLGQHRFPRYLGCPVERDDTSRSPLVASVTRADSLG